MANVSGAIDGLARCVAGSRPLEFCSRRPKWSRQRGTGTAMITTFPKFYGMVMLSLFIIGVASLANFRAQAQTIEVRRAADVAYEHGTNSAMRYLSKYIDRLRITLLLQECGLSSLSHGAAQELPDSVEWFLGGDDVAGVPPNDVYFAAQATRAYLLGYETGVRTEFRRSSPEWKEINCSASALAAKDYISR